MKAKPFFSDRRITNEAYHFTPLIEPAKEKQQELPQCVDTLTIYRDSGQLQLNGKFCIHSPPFELFLAYLYFFNVAPPIQNAHIESELVVYGILGFIRLLAGEYVIVITGCQRVGTLTDDILRATTFQILPIARSITKSAAAGLEDEQAYIHLLESHLRQNGFYFSYRYPITLSVQKQAEVIEDPSHWKNVCF